MTKDKLSVLIVCEHASNAFGGEAMLPLNYFMLLSSQLPNVLLLTHERVRPSIEAIAELDQRQVVYIPDTRIQRVLHRFSRYLPDRIAVITTKALSHFVTQMYQWIVARQLVKKHQIDVVHEVAPVSPRQPSMMFGLGVPVIIGPMNGGMTFPPAFASFAAKGEGVLYSAMRALSTVGNILVPGKLFATLLLVANERTRKALPKVRFGAISELVENGVFSAKVRAAARNACEKNEVVVLYVGRLIDIKAVDIAIEAIGKCHRSSIRLEIVGDGPSRSYLEAVAQSSAPGRVKFVGAVQHSAVVDYYDTADIFVLPSIRECGGAVVLEAMARGLPVIATNWGGPADYIREGTGILVDPVSREYMVSEFAARIDMLAANPKLRQEIGQAAIDSIREAYLWESKADRIIEYYKRVLQG